MKVCNTAPVLHTFGIQPTQEVDCRLQTMDRKELTPGINFAIMAATYLATRRCFNMYKLKRGVVPLPPPPSHKGGQLQRKAPSRSTGSAISCDWATPRSWSATASCRWQKWRPLGPRLVAAPEVESY